MRAQRWDTASPVDQEPSGNPVVDLAYTYDASDNRVLKSATANEGAAGNVLRHSVYISGGQELRGAQFGTGYGANGAADYQLDQTTEIAYLFAHGVRIARVAHDAGLGLPVFTAASSQQHVLINLDDTLGSTALVVDKDTGELVESATYLANGATESDYRPERWKGLREDYRFTGKEEDVEVGLQYFGKRFLSPYIGRWVSADPLAVHVPGKADWNLYAYVSGAVLRNVDPCGLREQDRHAAALVVSKESTNTDLQDLRLGITNRVGVRNVVGVKARSGADFYQDADRSAQEVARRAGPSGSVQLGAAHGTDASSARDYPTEASFGLDEHHVVRADIFDERQIGKYYDQVLKWEKMKVDPSKAGTLGATIAEADADYAANRLQTKFALDSLRASFKENGTRELVIVECGAGNNKALLQSTADFFGKGFVVRGTKDDIVPWAPDKSNRTQGIEVHQSPNAHPTPDGPVDQGTEVGADTSFKSETRVVGGENTQ